MITTQVVMAIREVITKVFGSINIAMIKMFDEHSVVVSEAASITTTATVVVEGL